MSQLIESLKHERV